MLSRPIRSRATPGLVGLVLCALAALEVGVGAGGERDSGDSAARDGVVRSSSHAAGRAGPADRRGFVRDYGPAERFVVPFFPWGGWPWMGWWQPPGAGYVPAGEAANERAVLETNVWPGRAELWVDGEFVGRSGDFSGKWRQLRLEPGRRTLEFRRPGYLTLRRVLDVGPGRFYRIDERLHRGVGEDPRSAAPQEPLPARRAGGPGRLRLQVSPGDAVVYLDGEFLSRASGLSRFDGILPLTHGVHVIEVVRPGYAPATREVEIAGVDTVRLSIELRSLDGLKAASGSGN